jgi:hypothetical protein
MMGEVVHRTAYFEKIRRSDREVIRWLPFYTVNLSGVTGRMFEPSDFSKGLSQVKEKEVNDNVEMFWGRQAGLSDEYPGQADMTLHSFDWEYPK